MSTDPDKSTDPNAPAETPEAEGTGSLEGRPDALARIPGSEPLARTDADEDFGDDEVLPTYKRFVYAAYFALAMLAAFIADRALNFAWQRLASWRPELGEPRDELVMPLAAILGGLVAIYYWRNLRSRELAESVAQELSKVTWPTKTEVMNNTIVVIVTTAFATVFFALMDRFWGFVTNLVYGT